MENKGTDPGTGYVRQPVASSSSSALIPEAPKSFVCTWHFDDKNQICGESYSTRHGLKKHVAGHGRWRCHTCNSCYTRKDALVRHQRRSEDCFGGRGSFEPVQGPSSVQAESAMATSQASGGPNASNIAVASSSSKALIAEVQKPFVCRGYLDIDGKECTKRYGHRSELTKHVLGHEGTWRCHTCNRQYTRESTLKKHLQTSEGCFGGQGSYQPDQAPSGVQAESAMATSQASGRPNASTLEISPPTLISNLPGPPHNSSTSSVVLSASQRASPAPAAPPSNRSQGPQSPALRKYQCNGFFDARGSKCTTSFFEASELKRHIASHKIRLCCNGCSEPFAYKSSLVRHQNQRQSCKGTGLSEKPIEELQSRVQAVSTMATFRISGGSGASTSGRFPLSPAHTAPPSDSSLAPQRQARSRATSAVPSMFEGASSSSPSQPNVSPSPGAYQRPEGKAHPSPNPQPQRSGKAMPKPHDLGSRNQQSGSGAMPHPQAPSTREGRTSGSPQPMRKSLEADPTPGGIFLGFPTDIEDDTTNQWQAEMDKTGFKTWQPRH